MSHKCLIIPEPGKELELVDKPLPAIPPEGALVKVHYCGMCHSDLHFVDGFYQLGDGKKLAFAKRPGYSYPIVPGHESSGVVAALGDSWTNSEQPCPVAVGDRVAVYSFVGCGECPACLSGFDNSCIRAKQRAMGFQTDGSMASHVAVPHVKFLVKVPASVDLRSAAVATCAGITAHSAVMKALPVVRQAMMSVEGQARVLIIGLGGLGLFAIQLANAVLGALGKVHIVAADISEEKLVTAQFIGAHATVLWSASKGNDQNGSSPKAKRAQAADPERGPGSMVDNEVDVFAERTLEACGGPPHAILDFVGSSVTAQRALDVMLPGGILAVVGLFGGSIKLELPLVILQSRTITGFHSGPLASLCEVLHLMERNEVHAPPVEEFSVHEANSALRKLRQGKLVGRAVLNMSEENA